MPGKLGLSIEGERVNIKVKDHVLNAYFRLIDVMHRPFVRRGVDDPYHAVLREYMSLSEQVQPSTILEIGSRNVSGIT